MTDNDFIWRFTPSRTEPELLEGIFVQRQALLTDIQERVADSATTGSMHHVLLIGPRGIGKTHLISLLHHRVTQDAALNEKLRIAWFLEDETITSFVQLLKRIYELLSDEHPQLFPKAWLESQLEKPPAQIEKNLEAELVRQFQDKTLLLFIENLDYVFDGLGTEGQKKWRSFLQEHPFTCIVATSQRLFRGVQKRTEPFFGFFAPIHLHPLKVSDAVELLSHIAEKRQQTDLLQFLQTPDGRSRVRAIHHLAGGNHRIYIVLSGFITRDSLDELTQPFEKMADELTPYYQERMRWLSPQQRQIVEFLCNQNSPCTPKEMARQMLAAENTISSQLKKLLEYGYVLRSPRGRESLYELAEPLMRLASEIKEKKNKPLTMLVDFLRIWYGTDRLIQMRAMTVSESLLSHLNEAIAKSATRPDPRLMSLYHEVNAACTERRYSDLEKVCEDLVHVSGSAANWLLLGLAQAETNKFSNAIKSYHKATSLDPTLALAWSGMGYCLSELNRDEEAIECYNRVLVSDPSDMVAMNNKGNSLNKLGRYLDAEKWLTHALMVYPLRGSLWNNKGNSLIQLNHYEEAIFCLNRAIELNPQDADAWTNKGNAFAGIKRFSDAIKCYDVALEIVPGDPIVWNNKSNALGGLGQHERALACFEQSLVIDPLCELALFNRSEPMFALGRWEAGFESLAIAFEHYPHSTSIDCTTIIQLIQSRSESDGQLRSNVDSLVQLCANRNAFEMLGSGLIQSLIRIDAERLSELALTNWESIWTNAGSQYPEMELPLRIFRVGIEYLKTKDERVMLDLITTERRILRQALGLEEMTDDEAQE